MYKHPGLLVLFLLILVRYELAIIITCPQRFDNMVRDLSFLKGPLQFMLCGRPVGSVIPDGVVDPILSSWNFISLASYFDQFHLSQLRSPALEWFTLKRF